jgi:predicted TIM-barrel fold metal-dependent hydrolase
VLIHTADPIAFWAPLDARNERLEELTRHPEWWLRERDVPPYERLIEALAGLVAAHPGTTFIGAHVASAAEDLARVDALLTALPNLSVDISARIGELGRQPRAARRLIERHPSRVLFGTDAFPPSARAYRLYFRALETADEHFAYGHEADDPWPQGRWRISGLDLPPDTLTAIYSSNAKRLIRIGDA